MTVLDTVCYAAGTASTRITLSNATMAASMGYTTIFFDAEMSNATRMPWDEARDRQIRRLQRQASYREFLSQQGRRSRGAVRGSWVR